MKQQIEKAQQINDLGTDALVNSGQFGVNGSRTGTEIDAPLTQPRSRSVPMTNDFDIDQTRRDLIALRVKHGANSKVGHRCSTLIEQLETLPSTTGDQRKHLQKSISRTVAELAGLQH